MNAEDQTTIGLKRPTLKRIKIFKAQHEYSNYDDMINEWLDKDKRA